MCHGHRYAEKGAMHGCGHGYKGGHRGWGGWRERQGRGSGRAWFHPPVNIQESGDRYELYFAAPGRSKEDFRISVKGDILTVAAPRKEGVQENEWKRQEYQLAPFERRFQLSDKVDPEGITAGYTDGILLVTLPKRPGAETPDQEIYVA